jgi:hypothetical protein
VIAEGSATGSATDWSQTTAPIDTGAPDSGNWSLAAVTLTSGASSVPALEITGSNADDDSAEAIEFGYWKDDGVIDPVANPDDPTWSVFGTLPPSTTKVDITSIEPDADYYAYVRYYVSGAPGDRLVLGPVTAGSLSAAVADGDYGDVTVSGGGTTFTIDATAEAERIRDVMGTALVAGSNVTVTVDDAGDTITIASTGGGGSGGALTLITEQVLASDGIPSDFTSIPATYRDLVVIMRGRASAAVTEQVVSIRYNSDSGSNYDDSVGFITNTTGSVQNFAQTSGRLGVIVGDSAPAGTSSVVEATIGDYRGTTFHKQLLGRSQEKKSNAANNYVNWMISMTWRSTAAITSINFLTSMKAGSVVSLYGRM